MTANSIRNMNAVINAREWAQWNAEDAAYRDSGRKAAYEAECAQVSEAAALLKELNWEKWAVMIGAAFRLAHPADHIDAINAAILAELDPNHADYADLLRTQADAIF